MPSFSNMVSFYTLAFHTAGFQTSRPVAVFCMFGFLHYWLKYGSMIFSSFLVYMVEVLFSCFLHGCFLI